jgi:class 3 adenylate cyclase
MDAKIQHGFLILADITGFTAYLSQVELDHAQSILAELLETIVEKFKTMLIISKLEGDAVFAYIPAEKLTRGETLLELIETTYLAFKDQVEATRRRTTCNCQACSRIPSLDLKFILHYGEYMEQRVGDIHELVGSDVNLVHRLLKNSVAETTGWRAYVLLTQAGISQLAVRPDDLHQQAEHYEHLGNVETYSYNLKPRLEALLSEQRVRIGPEDAQVITKHDYAFSAPVVWEWLNDPVKRTLWNPEKKVVFKHISMSGGRSGVGTLTHCVHGKKIAMAETVLDWHPFEYFSVEQIIPPFTCLATYELNPLPNGGTRLQVFERGRMIGIEFIDRSVFSFVVTKIFPTAGLYMSMDEHMQAAAAQSG